MATSLSYTFGNATDVGLVRQANEDYFGNWDTPAGRLFVVCDGMGGHVGGAVASQTATEAIHQYFAARTPDANPIVALQKALEAANAAILEAIVAQPDLQGMGTTAVVILVKGAAVYYAHMGDSRIYLLRNGALQRITTDHSFVQMLIEGGHITAEEAATHPRRNEISKALGLGATIEPAICNAPHGAAEGDLFLLCTDGLTGMVSDREIEKTLLGEKESLQDKATALIAAANKGGGTDNITVQLIGFVGKTSIAAGGKRLKKWILPLVFFLLLCGGAVAAWKMGYLGSDKKKRPGTEKVELPLPLPEDTSKNTRKILVEDSTAGKESAFELDSTYTDNTPLQPVSSDDNSLPIARQEKLPKGETAIKPTEKKAVLKKPVKREDPKKPKAAKPAAINPEGKAPAGTGIAPAPSASPADKATPAKETAPEKGKKGTKAATKVQTKPST